MSLEELHDANSYHQHEIDNALLLNQNTSQLLESEGPRSRRLAAGMNGSHKNFPEGILRSLLRSSSLSESHRTHGFWKGLIFFLASGKFFTASSLLESGQNENRWDSFHKQMVIHKNLEKEILNRKGK